MISIRRQLAVNHGEAKGVDHDTRHDLRFFFDFAAENRFQVSVSLRDQIVGFILIQSTTG